MNRRAAGMAGGLAAAVPAALFAALAGTALHRQSLEATHLQATGLGAAGAALPLGAVAALLLLASLQLFLGAAFRTLIPTAVCGALCYALAGWWSGMESGKRLIAGDLAGGVWVYGIVAVTVIMLVWCRRYRR
jgi:N-acetyl-1-D-myo-inositol-2-amino-2-deoxy-alpha-D-glucopyranoside deacetylase